MENNDKNLKLQLSIRLYTDEKCYGDGINTLLKNIDTLHSLRAAAKHMNMAYSKAWNIVKMCEQSLGNTLIVSSTGGKNGGGACLTDFAKEMITAYDEYKSELNDFADKLLSQKFSFIKDIEQQ